MHPYAYTREKLKLIYVRTYKIIDKQNDWSNENDRTKTIDENGSVRDERNRDC